MYTVDFAALSDLAALAEVLGCSEVDLERMRKHAGAYYVRHEIQKRGGHGKRVVWEICDSQFKATLQALAKRLLDFAVSRVAGFPHPACHGYMPRRSILTNAAEHIGTTRLLKSDIHEYFSSITRARLTRLFADLEIEPVISDALADLCIHDGALPLGSPASPVLANLVTIGLDNDLAALASRYGCTYTRYSDDITFSSNDTVPSMIELRSIFQNHGFTIVDRKTRYKKRGHAHYVTGLSISTNARPRASRRLKKRLRQEMYFIERYGLKEHLGRSNYPTFQSGINQIDGTLRWLTGIEPWFAVPMFTRWEQALESAEMTVCYEARLDRPPRDVVMVTDESAFELHGVRYLVVGISLIEDIDHFRDRLEFLRNKWLGDPFYTGKKKALAKKGIHWTDTPESSREELVRELTKLPFRTYAAMKPTSADTYATDYIFLLRELLKGRFTGLDGCNVVLKFEENSKIRCARVESLVEELFIERVANSERRPLRLPTVEQVTKAEEELLPVVDTMLGVLCRYLQIDAKSPSPVIHGVKLTAFERVRLKYRLILVYDQSYSPAATFNRWRSILPATAWPRNQG